MKRLLRISAALTLLAAAPHAAAQKADPPPTPKPAPFPQPKIRLAIFTHELTALLQPECERIATWLARYAAASLSPAILSGNTDAAESARRLLTLALHLDPGNASVARAALRWNEGQSPDLPPADENLRVLTDFLVRAAERKSSTPATTARQALLARFLIRIAADADPLNESAVHRSELNDRNGLGPPWRSLMAGRLGTPPPKTPARR